MNACGCVIILVLLFSLIMAQSVGNFGDLNVENTVFLLCDMQDFFERDIKHFSNVVATTNKMIAAANIFKIPVYVSEHDPPVYGKTVKSIKLDNNTCVYPKNTFSMYTSELQEKLKKSEKNIKTVVIFGVETHICIEQTVTDLVRAGYQLHVLADGVSSRSLLDRALALKRLQMIGTFVESSESVLYKLLKSTHHHHNQAITDLNAVPLSDVFGEL